MKTHIKICGLKEKSHALEAASAGADFIGLVLAPSRRQIDVAQAREITEAAKEFCPEIKTVGVFVNMPAPAVNRMARDCAFDWVQLSGDETWGYCQQIERPLIKTAHVRAGQYPEEIYEYLAIGEQALSEQEHRFLLDSRTDKEYGGTGETCDWSIAREIAQSLPVILAGGLRPENVTRAVSEVAPWGVDVSSGVETNGTKDAAKIAAFIEAVRSADKREK